MPVAGVLWVHVEDFSGRLLLLAGVGGVGGAGPSLLSSSASWQFLWRSPSTPLVDAYLHMVHAFWGAKILCSGGMLFACAFFQFYLRCFAGSGMSCIPLAEQAATTWRPGAQVIKRLSPLIWWAAGAASGWRYGRMGKMAGMAASARLFCLF